MQRMLACLKEPAHKGSGLPLLDTLPTELLEHTTSLMSAADVCATAQTCAALATLARSESVWRSLYVRDSHESCFSDNHPCKRPGQLSCFRDLYRENVLMRFDRSSPADDDLDETKHLKLLVVGESNVGKSAFLQRFSENAHPVEYVPTIGVDFKIKRVRLRGDALKLMLWDTAGQERFRAITNAYYRGAGGVFLCFDVNNRRSLECLEYNLQTLTAVAPTDCKVLLLGLKGEDGGDRQVSVEEAQALAAKMEVGGTAVQYRECSSLTGRGVESAVCALTRDVVAGWPKQEPRPTGPLRRPPDATNSACRCAIL